MSPTKIFRCRLSKQFVNQITLLCDGKCHRNAAKTGLRQLIVVYLLKVTCKELHMTVLNQFFKRYENGDFDSMCKKVLD